MPNTTIQIQSPAQFFQTLSALAVANPPHLTDGTQVVRENMRLDDVKPIIPIDGGPPLLAREEGGKAFRARIDGVELDGSKFLGRISDLERVLDVPVGELLKNLDGRSSKTPLGASFFRPGIFRRIETYGEFPIRSLVKARSCGNAGYEDLRELAADLSLDAALMKDGREFGDRLLQSGALLKAHYAACDFKPETVATVLAGAAKVYSDVGVTIEAAVAGELAIDAGYGRFNTKGAAEELKEVGRIVSANWLLSAQGFADDAAARQVSVQRGLRVALATEQWSEAERLFSIMAESGANRLEVGRAYVSAADARIRAAVASTAPLDWVLLDASGWTLILQYLKLANWSWTKVDADERPVESISAVDDLVGAAVNFRLGRDSVSSRDDHTPPYGTPK